MGEFVESLSERAVIICQESALLYWRTCRMLGIDLEACARASKGDAASPASGPVTSPLSLPDMPLYRGPEAFDQDTCHPRTTKYREVALRALRRTGLPCPLDVFECGAIGATQSSTLHSVRCPRDLGEEHVVPLGDDVYVCAPSLALLQMLACIDEPAQIDLLFEACGTYAVVSKDGRLVNMQERSVLYAGYAGLYEDDDQCEDCGPGYDHKRAWVVDGSVVVDYDYDHDYGSDYDPGFEERAMSEDALKGPGELPDYVSTECAQFTCDELSRVAERWSTTRANRGSRHVRGAWRLQKALPIVVPNSPCPAVTRVTMMLTIQSMLGGFGLPVPTIVMANGNWETLYVPCAAAGGDEDTAATSGEDERTAVASGRDERIAAAPNVVANGDRVPIDRLRDAEVVVHETLDTPCVPLVTGVPHVSRVPDIPCAPDVPRAPLICWRDCGIALELDPVTWTSALSSAHLETPRPRILQFDALDCYRVVACQVFNIDRLRLLADFLAERLGVRLGRRGEMAERDLICLHKRLLPRGLTYW